MLNVGLCWQYARTLAMALLLVSHSSLLCPPWFLHSFYRHFLCFNLRRECSTIEERTMSATKTASPMATVTIKRDSARSWHTIAGQDNATVCQKTDAPESLTFRPALARTCCQARPFQRAMLTPTTRCRSRTSRPKLRVIWRSDSLATTTMTATTMPMTHAWKVSAAWMDCATR